MIVGYLLTYMCVYNFEHTFMEYNVHVMNHYSNSYGLWNVVIANKNDLVFTVCRYRLAVCRHRLAVCNVTLQLHILAHNKNTDSLVALIVSCL